MQTLKCMYDNLAHVLRECVVGYRRFTCSRLLAWSWRRQKINHQVFLHQDQTQSTNATHKRRIITLLFQLTFGVPYQRLVELEFSANWRRTSRRK